MNHHAWIDRLLDQGRAVDAAAWSTLAPRLIYVYCSFGDGLFGTGNQGYGGGHGDGARLHLERYLPDHFGYPLEQELALWDHDYLSGLWP